MRPKRKAIAKARRSISLSNTMAARLPTSRAESSTRWKKIFATLESQLDFSPPEQIGVILYTEQSFADITRAPSWAGAINDGRIRIPVQGLTSVTPELGRVLKHELTHSFVGQKSHGRAPTWLQEGVAQYMEGRRTTSVGALLDEANQGLVPTLGALEGSWMGLSASSAAMAYAWSLAVVESIVQAGGMSDVSRLLDRSGFRAFHRRCRARYIAFRLFRPPAADNCLPAARRRALSADHLYRAT